MTHKPHSWSSLQGTQMVRETLLASSYYSLYNLGRDFGHLVHFRSFLHLISFISFLSLQERMFHLGRNSCIAEEKWKMHRNPLPGSEYGVSFGQYRALERNPMTSDSLRAAHIVGEMNLISNPSFNSCGFHCLTVSKSKSGGRL